jgi:hypothetical protein
MNETAAEAATKSKDTCIKRDSFWAPLTEPSNVNTEKLGKIHRKTSHNTQQALHNQEGYE